MPVTEQPAQTENNWDALKHREFDRYTKFLVDNNLFDGTCPFNKDGQGIECNPAWEKCKSCEHYDLIHAGFLDYICPDCGKYNALARDAGPIRTTDPVTCDGDGVMTWTAWYKCPLCGGEIEVEEST